MRSAAGILLLCLVAADVTAQQDSLLVGINVRMRDVELTSAVQALGRHLDKPLILGPLPDIRITLEAPTPVPREQVADLLSALLTAHDLELITEDTHYRIRSQYPGNAAQTFQVPGNAQGIELRVIQLVHARASEVASLVSSLYGQSDSAPVGSAPGPPPQDPFRGPPQVSQQPPMPFAGRASSGLEGFVSIVPDTRSNSLLVRANAADHALIEAAVRSLDVRPLQVLIEVLIAEVRRDRGYDIGTEFNMDRSQDPTRLGVETSPSSPGLAEFALRVMRIGTIDFDATLTAAERRGVVSIISRPVVLTANNEEAFIMVGSQRPFVQVSRSLPTDMAARDQVVQYRDVGTRLSVTPTVSADGYVMLTVSQEVNAATSEVAFDAPVISTRELRTTLLIQTGRTVVLGGLTDTQRDVLSSGVPLLSRLPLLGALFGRRSARTAEVELFMFLTPHVITSDEDAQEASESFRSRTDQIRR